MYTPCADWWWRNERVIYWTICRVAHHCAIGSRPGRRPQYQRGYLSRRGARIVSFDFPELRNLPQINGTGGLTAAEAWAWHREPLARRGADYDPRVATRIRRGEQISACEHLDVQAAWRAMQVCAAQRLREADAWLMPSVAVLPPRLDALERDEDFFAVSAQVLRNCSVINFLDGCAAALPLGPGVSLGVCGLWGQDARVLQVAGAIESALC